MKIGIPRAFLYYRYQELWETFFRELGTSFVVSPETGKDIVEMGSIHAVDEACLSSKIYLGHVEWLLRKCDYILVPWVSGYSTGRVCTKFQAIYDVVANTFRDRQIKLISYDVAPGVVNGEMAEFVRMGKFLGKSKTKCLLAYLAAKQAQKNAMLDELKQQERLFGQDGIKILVVSHHYNICDKFVGEPILNRLRELGAVPVPAVVVPQKEALVKAATLSETLPWAFEKELVGSVVLNRERVDGIVLLSTFPCGPDSLMNEMLIRRVKDKPVLNLLIDGHEGMAGFETRLESFLDIIHFKKEDSHGFL